MNIIGWKNTYKLLSHEPTNTRFEFGIKTQHESACVYRKTYKKSLFRTIEHIYIYTNVKDEKRQAMTKKMKYEESQFYWH